MHPLVFNYAMEGIIYAVVGYVSYRVAKTGERKIKEGQLVNLVKPVEIKKN